MMATPGTHFNYDVQLPQFTSKERDAETGLDWLEHRYLSSAQGRFTSPDPVFANVHRLFDPQQWNLYAYVRNNPLTLTDPSGLDFYETCTHTDSNGSSCQQVQNGSSKVWVQGTTGSNGQFTANRIANDANGNLVDTAHGNAAVSGTFDQNGVHFDGSKTANGQFIEGSNATKIGGSGTFDGITGNFFSACGGSCQARGTLTGTAAGFTQMKAGLIEQSSFKSFLDGFSGAHPFITNQWKDASGMCISSRPQGTSWTCTSKVVRRAAAWSSSSFIQ
jgi:RHS repeat-associated protein